MSIRDESRRTATRSNFFLIILLGVHSIAAHAVESLPTRNQFALTRNHGGEVCNVYLANLNRLEKWVPDGGRKIMPNNNSLESVVALHVNLDKMPEAERETFTA